jgi:hypothetical protein
MFCMNRTSAGVYGGRPLSARACSAGVTTARPAAPVVIGSGSDRPALLQAARAKAAGRLAISIRRDHLITPGFLLLKQVSDP